MKSTQYTFKGLPDVRGIFRSNFRLDRTYKTTFDCDKIIPIFIQETYPGDVFEIKTTQVLKAISPLAVPFMDNLHLDVMFFADASRNLWENWKPFMGEKNVSDTTEYTIPLMQCPVGGFLAKSNHDYFGLPTEIENLEVSTLPFRMLRRVYNRWFRDQNLEDKLDEVVDDGPDSYADNCDLLTSNRRHDYFTSCLPYPYKGDEQYLPLNGDMPVIGNDVAIGMTDGSDNFGLHSIDSSGAIYTDERHYGQAVGNWETTPYDPNDYAESAMGLTTDPDNSGMVVDAQTALGPALNDFRYAVAVQEMMERDARYGSRLKEMIFAHFGVTVPNYTIDDPEYCGGGHMLFSPMQILQTSQSDTTDQGTKAGFLEDADNFYAKHAAVEHGFLLGVMVVRADLTYQEGIQRFWSRQTREEFYLPVFANLGEMAVLKKEFVAVGTSADDEVFGYQDHWADLKYGQSMLTSTLRSNHSNSLDVWHLAEYFGSCPALNSAYMKSQAKDRLDDVLTITDNVDQFITDILFQVKAQRNIPSYANPQIGSRF